MERTPGPWYWDDGGYGEDCDPPEPGKRWISIYDDDDSEVCVIVNRTGSFSSNQFANARLIAAAPDMLEAIKNALRHIRSIQAYDDSVAVPKAFAISALHEGLKSAGIENIASI